MATNPLLNPLAGATAALLAALAGCTSPDTGDATLAFNCEDGTQGLFRVVEGGETAVLTLGSETLELEREEAASGARYGADGTVFWNRGDQATLERPDVPDTDCTLIGG